MDKKNDQNNKSTELCESIAEDRYFWNELHIIVEDGVKASTEED
ncbi:hypothetical protein [Bacillus sp. AK128]